MHINVRDILAEDTGFSRTFAIAGEQPELDQVNLTRPIDGEVKITRLDKSLVAEGYIRTEIELECHRCLCTFSRPTEVSFTQMFMRTPQNDEMPITKDDQIDLAEVIQQEILVQLPIKILHAPDCPGVADADPDLTTGGPDNSLGSSARITKGP